MSTPFSRTLRAVRTDSASAYVIAIAGALATLCAATLWLFLGSADVYVSSTTATFAPESYPHPIAPQVSGMVTEVHATLGSRVEQGDVLVVLDSKVQEAQLAEEQAHHDGTVQLLVALHGQITAQQGARNAAQTALAASTAAGRARVDVAKITLEYSQRRAEIIGKLREKELVAGLDSLQGEGERSINRAQAKAQQSDAIAISRVGRANLFDREAQIAGLQHDLASSQGELAASEARLGEIANEIERRRIRAPATGTIGDLSLLAPGATLQAGDRVGTIIPLEPVRLIARFNPIDAVGRVHQGQTVVVRVDQYPWTQYGTLVGTVAGVGTETRDERVRIDVDIVGTNKRIPTVDGLTGTAEIRLDQMRPYQLLLRLAGQLTASPAPPET